MKRSVRDRARRNQQRIERRLERRSRRQGGRQLAGKTPRYEIHDRIRATPCGGIGAMHLLANKLRLPEAIDDHLQVLKAHRPFQESDHVLALAFNILAGGRSIEDLELRREDAAFMDALGADRIPDPTTAGDFCRRFSASDIDDLMIAINEIRLSVWKRQSGRFFDEAVIDADGTLVQTTGSCKEGIGLNYKGQWGYETLLISLANTQEPLFLESKPGGRRSHEGAADRLDQARALCRRAGFDRVLMRGDTDFSQTAHLDRWDDDEDRFVFGYDARKTLVERAAAIPDDHWLLLERSKSYEIMTRPRTRPARVRDDIVRERGYRTVTVEEEHVSELEYSPVACEKTYRMVVLRKMLTVEKGQRLLAPEIRYFFYITNDREMPSRDVVRTANGRCAQEDLIGELKDGVRALRAPVGTLVSNWAYMVMATLAWTLKAWLAMVMPVSPRWRQRHLDERRRVLRMGFRTFVNGFMLVPAQVVRTARQITYRLLAWNRWQLTFLRALDGIRMIR